MKKLILFSLGALVVFFIFRLVYFTGDNYINNNNCRDSKYVAYNDDIIIEFAGYKIDEVKDFKIKVIQKNNIEKEIQFFKLDSLSYSLKEKILKTDTLLIQLKNKEFKIYDFKNEGWRQNAGRDKGIYYCNISSLTINSKVDSLHATNTITIPKIPN